MQWLLLLLGTVLFTLTQGVIVSIDYGTEWFKIGIVKPGTPFDLVLNAESKRKTDAIVAFKGDERVFESSARGVVCKFIGLLTSTLQRLRLGNPLPCYIVW
jgi:hypoxia up-regulated 1